MDSSQRGALMLVRLIAGCVMVIGLLDTGLYLTQCLAPKQPVPVRVLPIVLNLIPFIIGVVLLIRAKAIAGWINDKLE